MDKTNWFKIWVAFLAGCVASFQLGKMAASLALIIDEFNLSVFDAGLVVSLLTLTGAICGALVGLSADRYGHLRLAMIGLLVSACGSFYGAFSFQETELLFSRFIEGMGLILVIVALPSLIGRSSTNHSRPLAMGLWGAFMPAGIGVSMLISPTIISWHGWRGLWIDVGVLFLITALGLYLVFRKDAPAASQAAPKLELLSNAFKPGPLLVVGCFLCYSALFVPLTQFFPTLLVTSYEFTLANAAYLGTIIVLFNIFGNVAAGYLVRFGLAPWKILLSAFVIAGCSALMVYAEFVGPWMKLVAGIVFSIAGGLVPGTAFVLAAGFALKPTHMALIAGMLLQGAGIGQTMGPIVVSSLVDYFGNWTAAGIEVATVSTVGIICTLLLRKVVNQNSRIPTPVRQT
ncbi:MAG: MFS family permease [Parasphingorhabdus sp.]|jgi:MFS family permease